MPTAFEQKVYDATRRIPKGKVSTYGDIAEAIGTKAYRAVGQALHKNPYAPKVPCHRVVDSQGNLHGFAGGLRKKRTMLQKEGIECDRKRVKDFLKVRFSQ